MPRAFPPSPSMHFSRVTSCFSQFFRSRFFSSHADPTLNHLHPSLLYSFSQLHLNRSYYTNVACEPRGGTHKATFPCNHSSCHSDAYSTATHIILLPCTLALKIVQLIPPKQNHHKNWFRSTSYHVLLKTHPQRMKTVCCCCVQFLTLSPKAREIPSQQG